MSSIKKKEKAVNFKEKQNEISEKTEKQKNF